MQMFDQEPVILTVDDDPNLVDVVEEHVRAWGYSHCGVNDSAKMWEELERVIPSVILLDMKLGDDDGIALVSELKQRLILEALELTSGSVPKAAKHLGLSEVTLYRKIKRFGLARTFVKQQ